MTDSRKRVLLIEDHADARYLATWLLAAEGYQVTALADGRDALGPLGEADYAFVLLDLQLPELDGFEVSRWLRQRRPASELPIIAVSAHGSPPYRRKAFACGCTGFIEKPIDAEVFVAQVRCLAGEAPNA